MNVEHKRREISERLRKSNKEEYFRKVRMTLNKETGTNPTIQFTSSGQEEILDSIYAFRREGQLLNFAAINDYILGYPGELKEEFKVQVAKCVLERYRTNGYAIASLAHILIRCEDASWLHKIDDLKQKAQLVLEDNIKIRENERVIQSSSAVAFMFFGLLNFVDQKQDYQFLTQYYELFAKSAGFFDQPFLLLLETATHSRILLPSSNFVREMLQQKLVLSQFDPLFLMVLCEFLQNYVCHNLDEQLYLELTQWICLQLKDRRFSLTLKQNLINIVSITLSYDFAAKIINSSEKHLNIFQQISSIARFGNLALKLAALKCLHYLIRISHKERLQFLVEYFQLMEIMVFALQLTLDDDMNFRILESLALLMKDSQINCKIARNYGLLNHLYQFRSSRVVKIYEMAELLSKVCHDL